MNLNITFNPNAFMMEDGKYVPKISQAEYNGLSMNPDTGVLSVQKGRNGQDAVGGTLNIPGNAVAGSVNRGLTLLRLNSTVTRLETNDPHQEDGGQSILDIALHIIGRDQI